MLYSLPKHSKLLNYWGVKINMQDHTHACKDLSSLLRYKIIKYSSIKMEKGIFKAPKINPEEELLFS